MDWGGSCAKREDFVLLNVCREETLRSLFIHSLLKGKGAEPILAGRALGKLESF